MIGGRAALSAGSATNFARAARAARAGRAARAVGAALLALLLLPTPGAAQAPLERIDRLVEEGRVNEARGRLLDWWEAEWDDADRGDREHALWIRGLLTLEPTEASAIYRRMIVEYPAGAFSDRALGRLGAMAALEGDTLTAERWYAILQRDFPTSRAAAEAQRWLEGQRSAVERARAGRGAARAGAASRASTSPGAAGVRRDSAPPRNASAPPRGDWTVQLGAFAARGRAEGVADEIREAGFEVRVVQVEGSDLWRVRSGRFPDDADARDLYDRARAAGFDAAIVPGASAERGR